MKQWWLTKNPSEKKKAGRFFLSEPPGRKSGALRNCYTLSERVALCGNMFYDTIL
jgi:hypothetical protein